MMEITKRLNIWLYFAPFGSHAMERKQIASLVIDNRISQPKQWEDFGHEICHLLLHSGNQLLMHQMFLDFQEAKAKTSRNTFAYLLLC